MIDGTRHRLATFRPLTGTVELAIAEAREINELYPAFVTRILSAAVASIGPVPFSPDAARAISAADRQVLLVQLLIMMGLDTHWLQPWCNSCGERFDVPVTWSQLPVVEPPGDYPVFQGKLGERPIGLRVLTGKAEEMLSAIEDDEAALRALVDFTVDWGAQGSPERLDREALAQIEQQLEDGSPAITHNVVSQCPYCRADVTLTLDFIDGLMKEASILEDIHQIAMHYHWSESEITALPRQRRRQYLKMIDAARGMEE